MVRYIRQREIKDNKKTFDKIRETAAKTRK